MRGRLGRGRFLGIRRLPVSLRNEFIVFLLFDGLSETLLKLSLLESIVVFHVNFNASILQGIVGLVSDHSVLRIVVKGGGGSVCLDSKNSDDANNSN